MRTSTDVGNSASGKMLLIGGCYGTYFLYAADDTKDRTLRRQFLLANSIVLTLCMAIVALVVTVAKIVAALDAT